MFFVFFILKDSKVLVTNFVTLMLWSVFSFHRKEVGKQDHWQVGALSCPSSEQVPENLP
jgi:hypothetical protein